MELTPVIEATTPLKGPCQVELFTDSEYARKGITEWIHNWNKRGWKVADKKPVKNSHLSLPLDDAARRHPIDWHWVRGHDGNVRNERADALANLGVAEYREPDHQLPRKCLGGRMGKRAPQEVHAA